MPIGNRSSSEKNLFQTSWSMNGLALAAEKLGKDKVIMDSYFKFQNNESNWFFSPNPNLERATKKPRSFNSWADWFNSTRDQRMTLASLAGFKEDTTDVKKTNSDLERLKKAYKSWRSDLYSVFWGTGNSGFWMCNVFVGDAIYLWKKKSITNANKHYFDPKQIKRGEGPFLKVASKDLQRGNIVVFGSTHVEIVTGTRKFMFADDGFCAIGAGRSEKNETGIVMCDGGWSLWGEARS